AERRAKPIGTAPDVGINFGAIIARFGARKKDRLAGIVEPAGPCLFGVGAPGKKFSRRTVNHVVKRVAIAEEHHLTPFATPGGLSKDRDFCGIPVVQIMRRELEIPFEFPGVTIEREKAVRIKVVSFAVVAVPVRPGVSGAPVNNVFGGIVSAGYPCSRRAGF